MPSGRVHETVNLLVLPAAVYFLPEQLPKLPFAAGYLVGTFWLTPDLDLVTSRPSRRWGAFRLFWQPYAWLFPHRGLSHRPLIGAFTRVLYLAALAGIGLWVLDSLGYHFQFNLPLGQGWLGFFTGILIADLIHLSLDTFCKRF